jgi:hypothetical protein
MQPGTPEDHDQAAQPTAMLAVTGGAHDGDDLLDLGWIGGVAQTLAGRRPTVVESRHCGRRSAPTSAIEQQLRHDPSSGSVDEPRIGRVRSATLSAASADGRLPVSEWSGGGTGFAATVVCASKAEAVPRTAVVLAALSPCVRGSALTDHAGPGFVRSGPIGRQLQPLRRARHPTRDANLPVLTDRHHTEVTAHIQNPPRQRHPHLPQPVDA